MEENAIKAWSAKYLKLPDCHRPLLYLGGAMLISKFVIDALVKDYIFGPDGKGGEMLACYTRMNHHDIEYKEKRKRWYWHQKKAAFYKPQDYHFNDREKDYEKLSYGHAHENYYFNPEKDAPTGHNAEVYNFNEFEVADYYKR